jgi:hypothetical protein
VPSWHSCCFVGHRLRPTFQTAFGRSGGQFRRRPADYDLTVEATGFLKATIRDITVDAARETPVPLIKLALATVTQSADVAGDTQTVDLNNFGGT